MTLCARRNCRILRRARCTIRRVLGNRMNALTGCTRASRFCLSEQTQNLHGLRNVLKTFLASPECHARLRLHDMRRQSWRMRRFPKCNAPARDKNAPARNEKKGA